ncbi:MAG: peptidoglycan bridge formation glycyltransferase FemA/FemB family protein [Chloroflexi bacterium]|nr:peptidoglycan bridge formation glycyltransferase FemA/FemB family protein [Chloroflexota bacterium]MCY4246124.1 peptidoglycan bridge formation glycyltransferase FemA/FemB family protein [Chloroflexota bacterium]
MLTVAEINERGRWNDLLRELPGAHVLQTWDWGAFKQATGGWQPTRLAFQHGRQIVALASLATRRVGPLTVMMVSKGPALDYRDVDLAEAALAKLEKRARRLGNVWLKIDPDVIAATGLPGEEGERRDALGGQFMEMLSARGWRFSASQVQFRNTLTIDLQRPLDDILMSFSGNTRRKVRAAAKKGVTVRAATLDDLPLLYQLYQVTGARDQFLIRPFAYYQRAWRDFMRAGLAHALIAEFANRAIAHVILFRFGRVCWYFYGASANEERARMPNYALQWAALQWAKAQGCATYDMWGAPDVFAKSDPLWGVYQFKRGFRGNLVRHIGAWDFAPQPWLYRAYETVMPRLLERMKNQENPDEPT